MESGTSSDLFSGGEYEVFLSFRGIDTGRTFTDYLYADLKSVGVRTFREDADLREGGEMAPEVHKAIRESRISIPIFSRNYASSRWLLQQLTQMMECNRIIGQLILPIFYDVDQFEVRRQSGSYEEAFSEHERRLDERTVLEWRQALAEVGSLKGWEVNKESDGFQGQLIKEKIVPTVLLELKKNFIVVSDNLVGIDYHVEKMMRLLDFGSCDKRIVGIHGMAGIGKTTIAKCIYNKLLPYFECSSFVEEVRETVQQHKGLVSLQNRLLADTLRWHYQIDDVHRGIDIIKHRFFRKKVLIVLDDVNERSQFDWLVGNCDWFGPGSRIIVTTREERVLHVLQANGIYEPPFMNSEEALQLFSMHAFRRKFPPVDYDRVSREIASSAAGLPLALVVIGSFLSDRKLVVWKDVLKKMEKIPPNEVTNKLRISYDALSHEQKQIFLDIACLFFGMDKTYVFYMWEDCGYHPQTELHVLRSMGLVKVGDDNLLWMHNQLRALGRQIVREENIENPGKRSRLWDHEEALNELEQRTVEENVHALTLDFELGPQCCFTKKEFVKLKYLRYLQVDGAELVGNFEHLLSRLRWLNWRGCPPIFKPTNFHLKNLVILDLSHSDITEDWGGWSQIKMAEKLKVLELAYCAIRRTPDFSTHANLERLILRGCASLVKIDQSIANPRNLKVLDISETPVKKLPDEIWTLEKLQINATNCFYLKTDIPSCIWEQSSKRFLNSSWSSGASKRSRV